MAGSGYRATAWVKAERARGEPRAVGIVRSLMIQTLVHLFLNGVGTPGQDTPQFERIRNQDLSLLDLDAAEDWILGML
jgi:hypothetical protein